MCVVALFYCCICFSVRIVKQIFSLHLVIQRHFLADCHWRIRLEEAAVEEVAAGVAEAEVEPQKELLVVDSEVAAIQMAGG